MLNDFEKKGAFYSLLYKTDRFHVAVRLFSNRSHFDVICDLLLNRRTATWNLFFKKLFFLTLDSFHKNRNDTIKVLLSIVQKNEDNGYVLLGRPILLASSNSSLENSAFNLMRH